MPRISQIIIRTALVHLALGYTLGALVLAEKGLGFLPWLWALKASHVTVLLLGALVQLACGVAVWVLPRRDAAGSRGDMRPVWLGYAALNGGVALAALYPPLAATIGSAPVAWMPPLAAALDTLAVLAFVLHVWRRVLPFRSLARPARDK
jgi:hypothetical protein